MPVKTRKKAMHEHGEYMHLNWDCSEPETVHVRGHVTPAEFAASFDRYHWGDEPHIVIVPPEVVHEYGRWSRENGDEDYGNGSCVLRTYSERGAGRFPLTTVPYRVMNPPEHTCRSPKPNWLLVFQHPTQPITWYQPELSDANREGASE
jgi:hypothetical protein